jgi:hypothetical protein
MKQLTLIALASGFFFGAPLAAQAAGSTNAPFTVTATLTEGCSVSGATGYTFTYAGATNPAITNAAAGTITFTCTRGLTPQVVWDATNGSTTAVGVTATATGTAAGLVYTLDTGTVASAAGTAASTTVGATAATHAYSLVLNVAGNQPGDKNATTTSARTLILSY